MSFSTKQLFREVRLTFDHFSCFPIATRKVQPAPNSVLQASDHGQSIIFFQYLILVAVKSRPRLPPPPSGSGVERTRRPPGDEPCKFPRPLELATIWSRWKCVSCVVPKQGRRLKGRTISINLFPYANFFVFLGQFFAFFSTFVYFLLYNCIVCYVSFRIRVCTVCCQII